MCGGGFRVAPPHFLYDTAERGLRIVCYLRILVERGLDGLDSSEEQGSVGLRVGSARSRMNFAILSFPFRAGSPRGSCSAHTMTVSKLPRPPTKTSLHHTPLTPLAACNTSHSTACGLDPHGTRQN